MTPRDFGGTLGLEISQNLLQSAPRLFKRAFDLLLAALAGLVLFPIVLRRPFSSSLPRGAGDLFTTEGRTKPSRISGVQVPDDGDRRRSTAGGTIWNDIRSGSWSGGLIESFATILD